MVLAARRRRSFASRISSSDDVVVVDDDVVVDEERRNVDDDDAGIKVEGGTVRFGRIDESLVSGRRVENAMTTIAARDISTTLQRKNRVKIGIAMWAFQERGENDRLIRYCSVTVLRLFFASSLSRIRCTIPSLIHSLCLVWVLLPRWR